ncbi:DENN domain-containing protein Crag isoform X2 [Anthonomus grandis grandis]|uniref:DENN domain-containing protein Crag isoform X2 n=1 Tax=Anthonomus grandis grandis TaxID=2921223 RepID=UPI0021658CFC|nr:DENN domain-containing protein Crag isoform X2 [Anthonomus grandis grandis]
MEERRIADYFVVAGLPDDPEPLDDTTLSEGGNLKASHSQAPITDISVIFPSLGEILPDDWEMINKTPTGLSADLNHGSLRTIECFICVKRGRDKPPLVDIGVMYDGKEWLMEDAEVVKTSVGGNLANVNNSTSLTFITFRRGHVTMPCNALVVTDICVVIASKGESPPHAFCCINKNLNKGIVGSDVFLCYKKSMNRAKLLTYKPDILARYPLGDVPDFPFPSSVPLFCLPMGSTLELWPVEASKPRPVFSMFVLTVSDAKHKVYGSALTFYERFPVENVTDEQKELLDYTDDDEKHALYVNKSICVLSHWPFSDDLHTWLLYLYHMVTSGQPTSIPVERYIIQLLDEVPFPSPRTLLQLNAENQFLRVIFTQPEELPLPRSAASFKQLLLNLGSENCLQVLLLVLTEQKILIHSLRPDVLTSVAEAISSLLFPFKWQCPYIPLCPLGLVEVLHAPLPFLIGVDSRFFDLYDPPADVSCIDLDTNIITVCETQRQLLNTKLLPKKAAKCLKSALEYLYYQNRNAPPSVHSDNTLNGDDIEGEFQRRKKQQAEELEIQEAFLKFMVHILRGYRSYLLPITKAPTVGTTDPEALFQLNDFLKSRDKSNVKFFSLMMKTQMFIRFIEERSFVVDGDQGLTFFDDCIERLSSDENDPKLLELDSAHKNDRTVFVLPPEPTNESDSYTYPRFVLNPLLFLNGKRKNRLPSLYQSGVPGSPMARRTKHEIKSAQKLARKCQRSPDTWARCLCGTCHTLYFMILPSMISLNCGKENAILQQAYELLVRATYLRLPCDEVCYRLMMQLCGEHNRPLLAVKLLVLMKKYGIQPNALTYGLYNRCVLEAQWPAHAGSSQVLWNKLRNVIFGIAQLKQAARRKAHRNYLGASTEGGSSLLDPGDRSASRSSLDSHEGNSTEGSLLDRFRRVANSIVKGSVKELAEAEELDGPIVEQEAEEEEEEKGGSQGLFAPNSPSECRILSRSESAGDANLIDKLQSTKKTCSRNLQFEKNKNGEVITENDKNSPTKVSPREVITENDPLGAFRPPEPTPDRIKQNHSVPNIETNPVLTDEPVLFRNSVQRSATFEGSPPSQNKLHRSETVPASTVASSLASLGSTFKISFSRYTSQRLSLRKANLKVPQQFIENAITNLSPSSLAGKKSNELIQGSLSTIKSAANTMVKKMEEIKEAISTSANSTPVKLASGDRMASGDALNEIDGDVSGQGSDDGERIRKVSTELGSYRGSCANLKDYDEPLPESLYPTPEDTKVESELDITLTTCSQCHNCNRLLYDEDIMANWSAEDSNLNTLCQACNKPTVPLLTVSLSGRETKTCDPFSVPYLNPLVLRKELENILTLEGDLSISESKFIDEHPIIYWNLVWTFERINVQTHLPNLYFKHRSEQNCSREMSKKNSEVNLEANQENGSSMKLVEEGTDPLTQELAVIERLAAKVRVKCLWDEPKFHLDGPPIYVLWRLRDSKEVISMDRTKVTKSFMQQIINFIRVNDLMEPIKSLVMEREPVGTKKVANSIYRDILFLACKALGRAQIDINAFDKEYTNAYSRYCERNTLEVQDKPISLNALYCRQYFRPLLLP